MDMNAFKDISVAVIPVRIAVQQLTLPAAVVDPPTAAANLDGVVHPARQGLTEQHESPCVRSYFS